MEISRLLPELSSRGYEHFKAAWGPGLLVVVGPGPSPERTRSLCEWGLLLGFALPTSVIGREDTTDRCLVSPSSAARTKYALEDLLEMRSLGI